MGEITANVLFADDIRMEDGGKMLLIGAYGSDVIVSETLPFSFQIGTLVRIFGPAQTILDTMTVSYLLDRKTISYIALGKEQLDPTGDVFAKQLEMFAIYEKEFGNIHDATIAHGFIKVSLPITKEHSLLSVVVDVGNGPIAAGSLPIKWLPLGAAMKADGSVPTAANSPPIPG